MDQKPMPGYAPLQPPTPEIARLYLDEADVVRERRAMQVDTRAQGWGTLTTAALVFAFVTCNIALVRSDDSSAVPLFVLLLVAATQIIAGATESGGAQRRFVGRRWIYYGAVSLCILGILLSSVLYIAVGDEASFLLVAAPAWAACLILAGIGIVQLWSSRRAPRSSNRARATFELPARITTRVLGVILAGAIAASGIRDPLLSSVLAIIAGAAMITVTVGVRSDWGLGYLGEVWRWPQYVVFGMGALILCLFALAPATDLRIPLYIALISAAAVAFAAMIVSRPHGAPVEDSE